MEDLSIGTLLLALLLILLGSAFFSASETSMMALSRHRLNYLVKQGNRSAKLTARLLSQTDKLLGSILFGNTLLNAVAASLTGVIVLRLFGDNEWALLAGTLAITCILLVFSEIMPKVVAASYSERIALTTCYALAPLNKLFYPVVAVASAIVRGFLGLLHIKIETDQSRQKVSLEEVRALVLEGEHFLPHKHQTMLLNLMDLERVTVNDVMVPRNQMEVLDLADDPETVRQQLATAHHTMLPVCEGGVDNIIGVLHVRKTLSLWQRGEFDIAELRELLVEPYFIPSGTSLLNQLQYFQERHARFGLIVDEYGELLGLVTLENILEEIVGDFTTQSPVQTGKFMRQEANALMVEGSISLRELNRKMGLQLPLTGAKTLNGLILEHLQDIPEAGTSVKIAGYPMEIIQTQEHAVKVVRIYLPQRGKERE